MLDVHPPHQAAHTWKDFFIHIATIVIGLLIAIGLEQTVEWFQHKREVREAREALRQERELNHELFGLETGNLIRRTSYLKTNLAVMAYLRSHPNAPRSAWPGSLDWSIQAVPFSEAAWATAQRDGVVELMPTAEVQDLSDLYVRLDRVRAYELDERTAIEDARGYLVRDPDPTHLTPRELDNIVDQATHVVVLHARVGEEMLRLSQQHPDFARAPTHQQLDEMVPAIQGISAKDRMDNAAMQRDYYHIVNPQ